MKTTDRTDFGVGRLLLLSLLVLVTSVGQADERRLAWGRPYQMLDSVDTDLVTPLDHIVHVMRAEVAKHPCVELSAAVFNPPRHARTRIRSSGAC